MCVLLCTSKVVNVYIVPSQVEMAISIQYTASQILDDIKVRMYVSCLVTHTD